MKKIAIVLLLFLSQLSNAQDLSIRTNAGFAGFGSPVDGYYFSFDIGKRIIRGVEIAPTFTFATRSLKKNSVYYYWNNIHPQQYIINKDDVTGNYMTGLFEVFVNINPFKLFSKNSNVDFAVGAGYGLGAYAHNYYNYSSPNGNHDFVGIIHQNGVKSLYSVKMYYNYHYKKFFTGIVVGAHFIDESFSILGLQFGVNI